MASYFTAKVADRLVKVATGTKSQTVNICTPAAVLGTYEAVYRLPISSAIQSSDLSNRGSLQALCEWLELHNGRLEHRSATGAAPTLAATIAAPQADDEWVQCAVQRVDRVISRIVAEFIADPLMHRVEHSLHARIWALLTADSMFREPVDIGKTGRRTQLVHKEWPETIPEPDHHRGLFDLAVLSPRQLEQASVKQFRQGRLDAPIVIEVGLDYGFGHLHADQKKVIDSKVPAPYLLHLSRIGPRDEAGTEKLLCAPEGPVRTAYVHHASNGACAFKQLDAATVSMSVG